MEGAVKVNVELPDVCKASALGINQYQILRLSLHFFCNDNVTIDHQRAESKQQLHS